MGPDYSQNKFPNKKSFLYAKMQYFAVFCSISPFSSIWCLLVRIMSRIGGDGYFCMANKTRGGAPLKKMLVWRSILHSCSILTAFTVFNVCCFEQPLHELIFCMQVLLVALKSVMQIALLNFSFYCKFASIMQKIQYKALNHSILFGIL